VAPARAQPPLRVPVLVKRGIRALTSLRLRNQLRLLLGLHPMMQRQWFPDLEVVELSRGDLVIDVGACVGDFSESILAHQPWAKIHAFEPLRTAFVALRKSWPPSGVSSFVRLH
jgi:hypothetical protein